MRKGRFQDRAQIDRHRNANHIRVIREQAMDRTAQKERNHGCRAAVIFDIEPHKLALWDHNAVNGRPRLFFESRRLFRIQLSG